MAVVALIVDSDATFEVDVSGVAPVILTQDMSLSFRSRCQLERLAVAIKEALHGGDCEAAYAEHGGEAGGP